MQFFHLFSFVVVASYAAAFPQPAELSEKYLNNADFALASGLEARSYQPGFNSQKGSATLVSLERRGDSEGSSEENSESDSSPSPDTTPEKKFSHPFTEETVNSMALASTIDSVGDGIVDFYENGEKAGQKIGGDAGDLLTLYLRVASYVNAAMRNWVNNFLPDVLLTIKSGLSEEAYSKFGPDSLKTIEQLKARFSAELKAVLDATSNIANDVGLVAENLQTIDRSFKLTVYSRTALLSELRSLLDMFEAGATLEVQLADISRSIDEFGTKQNALFAKVMEEYEAESSQ
ncbi:hypothetical protein BASA50_002340 [Batrachochytrium salamandrivorans]|uniref:Uncharacterized protein n=1 Tax=Batrachochytrium salamandrivorans TaxID=1357716 RepID=A0ABQ8FLN0_9FUNG|nr:hypothetical protein BASA60_011437 [Batrachochytrium salamandrivorans]KAH6600406.1 hypothetical protein BASA50_002340 [Batrachochytrium salamandrivorans]KAH9244731.1 hypothetical protein BASA81_017853 [Batrachochytrium salamandrivorans]KAH9263892.1 hypothetical protein BASA83_012676 [Batrachochytrium salamandrivorans]